MATTEADTQDWFSIGSATIRKIGTMPDSSTNVTIATLTVTWDYSTSFHQFAQSVTIENIAITAWSSSPTIGARIKSNTWRSGDGIMIRIVGMLWDRWVWRSACRMIGLMIGWIVITTMLKPSSAAVQPAHHTPRVSGFGEIATQVDHLRSMIGPGCDGSR